MNIPAIAKKTFDEFANEPEYIQIQELVQEALREMPSSIERAKFLHQAVDHFNNTVFNHPLVQQFSPCKSGCSACCHTQVSATQEEAELLLLRIEKEGIKIDIDSLIKQAAKGNETKDFYSLSYKERGCVFLDEKGRCRAYSDRPMVCRTNAVLGESSQCDTKNGTQGPVRLVKTSQADMVIVTAFQETKTAGTLPYLLLKTMIAKKSKLLARVKSDVKSIFKDFQL